MFRPRRVVPNTLDPSLAGLDHACIEGMFADCLSNSPSQVIIPTRPSILPTSLRIVDLQADNDATLKNLEGGAKAVQLAVKWADDSGRLRKKLERMGSYLTGKERDLVQRLLSGRDTGKSKERAQEGKDAQMREAAEESQVEDVWRSHSRPSSAVGKAKNTSNRSTTQPKLAPISKPSQDPKPVASVKTVLLSSSSAAPTSHHSRAPTVSTSSSKGATPREGIQGKASMAETERAIARIREANAKLSSRSKNKSRDGFKVPSVYLQNDSDEDTDDSDAEAARERTMHMLFAPLVGIDPGPFDSGKSSSPIPEDPVPMQEYEDDVVPKKPTGKQAATVDENEGVQETPKTPTMKAKNQLLPEPLTPLSQAQSSHRRRHENPRIAITSSSQTRTREGTALGSLMQLHAPAYDPEPSSLERQLFDPEGAAPIVPSRPQSQHEPSSSSARKPTSTASDIPFIDLHNVQSKPSSKKQKSPLKRRAEPTVLLSFDDHSPPSKKRRRFMDDPTLPLPTTISQEEQAEVPAKYTKPSFSERGYTPCSSSVASDSEYERSSYPLPDERPVTPQRPERPRPGLSQRFSTLISDELDHSGSAPPTSRNPRLTSSSFSASRLRSKSRVTSSTSHLFSSTLLAASSKLRADSERLSSISDMCDRLHQVPDDLFVQSNSDARLDPERTRKLADQYRVQMKEGKRLGLIVPRLACTDSQEESQGQVAY